MNKMSTMNKPDAMYVIKPVHPKCTVSYSALEPLVLAYVEHINYLGSNAENAFERVLCDCLKNDTCILDLYNLIIKFRSNNRIANTIPYNILVKFTEITNPITNTWKHGSTVSPLTNDMKIGAIASAIEGRIIYFYKLCNSYEKMNPRMMEQFRPYIENLYKLSLSLVNDTRTAISNATIAGKEEYTQRTYNEANMYHMQQMQQMQQIQQMQQMHQMHQMHQIQQPYSSQQLYQMQHVFNLQQSLQPIQTEIPGVCYDNGFPSILVKLPSGIVVTAPLCSA